MLRILYWVGVAAFVLTVLGLLAPWVPECDLINHFRPLLVLLSLTIAIAAFAKGATWRLGALLPVLLNIALVVPVWLTSADAWRGNAGDRIKIVSFNLSTPEQLSNIERFVASEDPDVVVFQEFRDPFRESLAQLLRPRFPYQHVNDCNVALLSKSPLRDVQQFCLIDAYHPRFLTGIWTSSTGRAVRIAGVHMHRPYEFARQAREIDWIVQKVRSWREPLVMVGDFSLTPWSYLLNKLAWMGGVKRAATFGTSWPVVDGFAKTPVVLIDHAFVSPGIGVESIATGPDLGSDHLPVIATLRLP